MKKDSGMYWSLRNKTEDVERALTQGDLRAARLAALELGVRLSTTAAPPLQDGGADFETRADADGSCADKILSMFARELQRLVAFLKQDDPARAGEVVHLLFKHLATLDGKGER